MRMFLVFRKHETIFLFIKESCFYFQCFLQAIQFQGSVRSYKVAESKHLTRSHVNDISFVVWMSFWTNTSISKCGFWKLHQKYIYLYIICHRTRCVRKSINSETEFTYWGIDDERKIFFFFCKIVPLTFKTFIVHHVKLGFNSRMFSINQNSSFDLVWSCHHVF